MAANIGSAATITGNPQNVIYRREFIDVPRIDIEKPRVRVNTALLWKSVAAAGVMIILFFMGFSVSKVAVVTGAILSNLVSNVPAVLVFKPFILTLLTLWVGVLILGLP